METHSVPTQRVKGLGKTVIDLRTVNGSDLQLGKIGAEIVMPEPDVTRRALLAFLKAAKSAAETPKLMGIEHVGKRYVALLIPSGIAAIYRVRNDLQLKRMRRIPQPVAYAAEHERRTIYA